LLEFVFAKISNAANRRIGRGGNFDQVQSGFFGAPNSVFEGHDPDLLAFDVENADLRGADLMIGAWACWRRWSGDEWWTRNVCFSWFG